MRRSTQTMTAVAVLALAVTALPGLAQSGMDHSRHGAMTAGASAVPAGQDAYEAIAAIIAQLEADSTTDWSKVNVEALRRHLVVMNDVTLGARSVQASIGGGARMDVTGDGRVAASIRAMLHAHAPELDRMGLYRATVLDIPRGALPVTERVANEIVSLPMYPELTRSQLEAVVMALTDVKAATVNV